jgi:predicted amidohydrolase YtcJ
MSWLLELACGVSLLVPQGHTRILGTTVHRDPGAAGKEEAIEIEGRRFISTDRPGPVRWWGEPAIAGGHSYSGLQDAHGHVLGLGRSLENVDLTGTKSYEEVVARVVERAKRVPKGEWIEGRGWDQNRWPKTAFPHHASLSAAVSGHPVWLVRVDGHAALANAAALELAGIGKTTEPPTGGEILRDEGGAPTGVFVDNAMGLLHKAIPDETDAQRERWLLAAQKACLEAGLTCVHDAGVDAATLRILKRLWVERRWKLRVYAMVSAGETELIKQGPWQTPDLVIVVRAVKGYADGALGSRGAWLLADYSDRAAHRGLYTTAKPLLQKLAQLCADSGFQLCVHAIGDRANREVLDVFEAVKFAPTTSLPFERWRVEHAQVVSPPDFDRFRDLGVLASMQPTHLTSDMPWAVERLGPERTKGAYAWRSFLERKVPLPFGSDFPVESHDPRKGLYAAVTTKAEGSDKELRPEQKLTRQEALLRFTRDAAYAAFAERELGRIAPGYLADLTIFDRDLEKCPEQELLTAKVLATVIGGEVVYRAPEK